MYPSLYYLFQDLFGVELGILKIVQSFGFFVALAFVLGSYVWSAEIRRKRLLRQFKSKFETVLKGEKTPFSSFLPSILTGFVFGYKMGLLITDYEGFTNDPQGYLLSLEGSFLFGIIAAGGSYFLRYREAKKEELPEPKEVEEEITPESHVSNMVMLAALFGIIGAKLFHLLENPDQFKNIFDGASFFSGLTMYGGLIVGAAAVLTYAKKHNFNLLHVVDSSVPTLLLGYAVGRVGCQIAGDGDWGVNNLSPKPDWMSFLPDWMWAYNYPNNVNRDGIPIPGCEGPYCFALEEPVWPTPFYETTMCLLLLAVVWKIRTKPFAPGVLFSIYLIMNGVERFMIEKIRVNVEVLPGITQAEIISSIFIVLGGFGIWYFTKNRDKFSTTE